MSSVRLEIQNMSLRGKVTFRGGWVIVVGSPPGMGVPSKEHHAWLGPLVHGQASYSLLRVV